MGQFPSPCPRADRTHHESRAIAGIPIWVPCGIGATLVARARLLALWPTGLEMGLSNPFFRPADSSQALRQVPSRGPTALPIVDDDEAAGPSSPTFDFVSPQQGLGWYESEKKTDVTIGEH